MRKVRLLFVGFMLMFMIIGFTSCGNDEDFTPDLIEINDVESDLGGAEEDPEESGDPDPDPANEGT